MLATGKTILRLQRHGGQAVKRLSTFEWVTYGLAIFAAVVYLNWTLPPSLPKFLAMNDVFSIRQGYLATANPLKYFIGPWIEVGTPSYRPLSSLLLYGELRLADLTGSLWPVVLTGYFLHWVAAFLAFATAWVYSKGSRLVAMGAGYGTAMVWITEPDQPRYWLNWMPIHHDILNAIAMLLVVYFALRYREDQAKWQLKAVSFCSLLGFGVKEFAVVYPLMALVIVWPVLAAKQRWQGLLLAAIVPLDFLGARRLLIPHLYNPNGLKFFSEHLSVFGFRVNYYMEPHFVRRPFLNLWHPLYRYVDTGDFSTLGVFCLLALGCYYGFKLWGQSRWGPYACIFGIPLFLFGYLQLVSGDGASRTLQLFNTPTHKEDFVEICALMWTMFLLCKYRRTHPTGMAFTLLCLSYVPVFTLLGWHYFLPGGYMRMAVYWPVVAMCAWQELSGFRRWCLTKWRPKGSAELAPHSPGTAARERE